jgi:cyclophilin family peptidyl-prolyl cis-trans isomerase
MFKSVYFFYLGLIFCTACKVSPPSQLTVAPAPVADKTDCTPAYVFSFADPIVREIYQAQFSRDTSFLLRYLSHQNQHYRQLAARALGSFQELGFQPLLAEALQKENEPEVAQLMVFAMGQSADPGYFRSLYSQLKQTKEPTLQEAYLAAMGKCATEATIGELTDYEPTNESAAYGQLYGVFQASARKIKPPTLQPVFDNLKITSPERNRILAATYLARFSYYDYTPFTLQIANSLQFDPLPRVRAQTALALAHSTDRLAANTLHKVYHQDGHPKVKLNVIKALAHFPGPETNSLAESALFSTDPALSETAAQYFVDKDGKASAIQYIKWLPNVQHVAAKALLLRAAIAQGYQTKALEIWEGQYHKTSQPYEKVQWLKALHGATAGIPKLMALYKTETQLPVKTALLEAMASTLAQKGYFEKNPKTYQALTQLLQQALFSADPGAVCTVAPFFGPGEQSLAAVTGVDAPRLKALQQTLKTPENYEAFLAVGEVLKSWGEEATPEKPLFYDLAPFNWDRLNQLGLSPKILVATSKGPVTLLLFPEMAPFTVMAVLNLAETDFYSGKSFHRVVPGFVAQAGCPRGDGFGGVDFMIRSEFSELSYIAPGMVGMANAGPDTEGSQWFINTVPTPHLDGRYTIFAQVLSGFDVVEKLQPGDWIEKIEILKEY